MKTTAHYLKIFCFLVLPILSYACPALAVGSGNENEAVAGENKALKEKMVRFFLNYLSGDETLYQDNKPVSLADIARQRQLDWDAWVEPNNRFDEQKLIGLGKLEQENSGNWDLTGILLCQKFDDVPSAYFIPQIPNMGNYYRWWQKSKQFAWEKVLRLAFVSGNINPDKVYFFGISEGGYGSQRLASYYADYLAGAGPMAGGEPLKNAPVENCRNIAFSFLTGAADAGFYRNKLTTYTKNEFERLKKLYPEDYIHRIELIPGRGHAIDYTLTTPWLKQYTRNPYPKNVNWENFEMDGMYRKGFYNLAVKERSNDDYSSRTYYELAIKENEISLKVDLVTYKTVETDPNWGIELKFEKDYRPATKGKVVIYLCTELVDLNKKITLIVNGKKAFQGKVKLGLEHMVNSCATFYDPARIYPAAIEVNIK